jgi:hypothetical protein
VKVLNWMAALCFLFAVVGCDSGPTTVSEAENKAMADGFKQDKLDLSKVPEKDRERVKAFMEMSKNNNAPAPTGN